MLKIDLTLTIDGENGWMDLLLSIGSFAGWVENVMRQ